jgi:hypothetical protein
VVGWLGGRVITIIRGSESECHGWRSHGHTSMHSNIWSAGFYLAIAVAVASAALSLLSCCRPFVAPDVLCRPLPFAVPSVAALLPCLCRRCLCLCCLVSPAVRCRVRSRIGAQGQPRGPRIQQYNGTEECVIFMHVYVAGLRPV